jgi:Tol biopolymer transport system component
MDTGTRDVFVRIIGSSTTTRISDNRGGVIGARNPHISADGLWVVFETGSTTMAAGVTDTNNAADIVRCSSSGGSCAYLSLAPSGSTGDHGSARPWLSQNGALVAFESDASNLDPTDGNFLPDVFVYDTVASTLRMRSVNGFGALADGAASRARFDPTGRYLLYQSAANNMQNDPAGAFDSDGGAADVFMIRLP